jgi:hypothetical protein
MNTFNTLLSNLQQEKTVLWNIFRQPSPSYGIQFCDVRVLTIEWEIIGATLAA